uniref:carboxypeptidase-like regulatory domain-containing protein n=1 Tax=Flavobacterium sp. TaxID=239 RepID=UPI004049F9A1
MKYLHLAFFLLLTPIAFSQIISGKLVDNNTKEPISYAHITISNEIGVVSNEEGLFSLKLDEKYANSTVQISALGYEIVKITVGNFKPDMEILMHPTDLILDEVVVGIYNNPIEIINKYVENSQENHSFNNQRMLCFTRTKESYLPSELEIEVEEISFHDKKNFQKQINAFTNQFIGKKATSFTENLYEIYFLGKKTKVNPLKALKLSAENGLDIDNFQEKFLSSTFKYLESPYSYRIKSGWIPLEKDVSLDELNSDDKEYDTLHIKNINLYAYNELITYKEFVKNPKLYDYKLEGIKKVQGFSCYHISFKSSKNKGKYKGNLFINEADFALIRYQYELDDDKKEFGINLKWVLGIKVNTFESSKEVQFALNKEGFYYPILSRTSKSDYAYVHRGLTMKENNPERSKRKKMKLDFKIEMITNSINEKVILEIDNTSEDSLVNVNFNEFVLYENKLKYDSNFWEPYQVLEATKEIKQFDIKPN